MALYASSGTLIDETFIEKSQHNYLLAADLVSPHSDQIELAWMDTSTGELFTQSTSLSKRTFQEDIGRISPREVVLPRYFRESVNEDHRLLQAILKLDNTPVISYPKAPSAETNNTSTLVEPFTAVPLLASYISETLLDQHPDLDHPLRVSPDKDMRIDRISLRALEVLENNDGGTSGTLLSVMDKTVTSAGQRLLSDRLTSPSKIISEIQGRLSLVSFFKQNEAIQYNVVLLLKQLDDESRLLQKMSIGRPTAEDLLAIAKAIRVQGQIKSLIEKEVPLLRGIYGGTDLEDIASVERLLGDLTNFDHLAAKIEASVDIKALEAQRTRDFAAEAAASQAAAGLDADMPTDADEGVDIWNIPFGVVRGKDRRTKSSKLQQLQEEQLPVEKEEMPAIAWGKMEASVLQPRLVQWYSVCSIGHYLSTDS